MRIQNVAASFPQRKVSNPEVMEVVRQHSTGFQGDLDKCLRAVKTLLERSGLVTRHWLGEGERPIEHLSRAVNEALHGSGLRPRDVDLFVYVGIGGGFREPGNSYVVAKALGFSQAECFDVVDACMSWTRAMYLVDSLFKTRKYRNAMIVNGEFNIMNGATGGLLNVGNFTLDNVEQLEHALPTYTIGEAATATLLLPDDPENFNFTFRSMPDYADLCTIPETGFEGFSESTYHLGRLGTGRFSAHGTKLHAFLEGELPEVFKAANPGDFDIAFTHTSSKAEWARFGEKCGIGSKIYHTYDRIGNVVSASIPASMALARADGRLKKGDRVLSCMGSAGMSLNVTTFNF